MERETIEFDIQLNTLKSDFNDLYEASNDVEVMFEALDTKIKKLNGLYSDLLKTNKDNKILVFGLDSFNFQTVAIHEETSYLRRFRNLLYNRIYADYFKLNKLVIAYVKEKFEKDSKIYKRLMSNVGNFPRYDYLDIYKYYEFNLINELFQEIIGNIQTINEHSKSLQMDLHFYKLKGDIGLNINNFVYGHEYMNNNIRSQIKLFTNYLHFFLNLHTKYLTNFMTNVKLMHGRLRSDINLDEYVFSKSKGNSPLVVKRKTKKQTSTFLNPKEREQFDQLLENTNSDNIIHRSMSNLIRSMSPGLKERSESNESVDYSTVVDESVVSEVDSRTELENIVYSSEQGEKHKIEKIDAESDKSEETEKSVEKNEEGFDLYGEAVETTENKHLDELVQFIEEDSESSGNVKESKSKKRRKRKKKKQLG